MTANHVAVKGWRQNLGKRPPATLRGRFPLFTSCLEGPEEALAASPPRRRDAWPLIFLLERAGILQVKQPVGKMAEVLDGKVAGNIVYWVCITCYESRGDNRCLALEHNRRCASSLLGRLR